MPRFFKRAADPSKSSGDPWPDETDGAYLRPDVNEHGVGSGNYSSNHGGHTYDDLNLTSRQREVIEAYLANDHSCKNAARELGMGVSGVTNTMYDIASRLGLERAGMPEIVDAYLDAISGETSTGDSDDVASWDDPS